MIRHTINLVGIKSYSYHGVLPEENKIGNQFETDVKIVTNFTEAAENDDLTKTINYALIYQIVEEEMNIPSKLIEAVAQRIVNRLKKEIQGIEEIRVEIKKIHPPVNGIADYASVVIEERLS